MKKIMLTALSLVAMATAQAQINLGKMAGAASKGVQALSFSNADAQKLSKESVDWMDTHNQVADANSPYTKPLTDFLANTKTKMV